MLKQRLFQTLVSRVEKQALCEFANIDIPSGYSDQSVPVGDNFNWLQLVKK
jgi:hypothetical protein